jgi:hypothetical protein
VEWGIQRATAATNAEMGRQYRVQPCAEGSEYDKFARMARARAGQTAGLPPHGYPSADLA